MLQRLAWRKDSCQECVGPGGEDLSGGYYEAGGSYLKFTFPTAFTITQLSWGVVEYRDGYEKAHELREALEAIKWGTDYLLNCIGGPDKIIAMFGSSEVSHIRLGASILQAHRPILDRPQVAVPCGRQPSAI